MKVASVNAERDFADGKGRSGRGQTWACGRNGDSKDAPGGGVTVTFSK